MFGVLKRMEITDDLIMNVAREKFAACNEGVLDDQNNYVKGMWLNGTCDMLEDFNNLVCIFKKIHFECELEDK